MSALLCTCGSPAARSRRDAPGVMCSRCRDRARLHRHRRRVPVQRFALALRRRASWTLVEVAALAARNGFRAGEARELVEDCGDEHRVTDFEPTAPAGETDLPDDAHAQHRRRFAERARKAEIARAAGEVTPRAPSRALAGISLDVRGAARSATKPPTRDQTHPPRSKPALPPIIAEAASRGLPVLTSVSLTGPDALDLRAHLVERVAASASCGLLVDLAIDYSPRTGRPHVHGLIACRHPQDVVDWWVGNLRGATRPSLAAQSVRCVQGWGVYLRTGSATSGGGRALAPNVRRVVVYAGKTAKGPHDFAATGAG